MCIYRIVLPLIVAAIAAAAPQAAHGQEPQRFGGFSVYRMADSVTGVDKSNAGIVARSGDRRVAMTWLCSGSSLWMGFGFRPNEYGRRVRATLHFDAQAPDSITLSGSDATTLTYDVPDDRVHAVTTRIRGASWLVMRVQAAAGPVDYAFDLEGAESALGSLPCVAGLRPPAPR